MNNSLHVVTKKYLFYEAKSVLRNPSEYSEDKFKESKIIVDAHYKKNPHLLEPVKKVDKSYLYSEECKRMEEKYKI